MQWEALFGKLFCVFVGFVRVSCRFSFFFWLGCVGYFLEFFLSHLQVNRLEDQSLLMPLNYDPQLLVLPKHKKTSSGQRISPWAWCNCSLCAPQLYMKQPANLHPVASDGSYTCQRVPKLLGVRDFTYHIRSLLTGQHMNSNVIPL